LKGQLCLEKAPPLAQDQTGLAAAFS